MRCDPGREAQLWTDKLAEIDRSGKTGMEAARTSWAALICF
jgi:hypothetical protein